MDKGAAIDVTKKWMRIIEDLPYRFNFTESEKNALFFALELYKKELSLLQAEEKYKGL